MKKIQPIERQWLILRTLVSRRNGATVRELAAEYECSQRTIRRDLDMLQGLGFPVDPDRRDHGRNHWVSSDDSNTPSITFDFSEVLSFYVSRKLFEPLAGTVFWEALHSAFKKMKASLSDEAIAYLNKVSMLIHRTDFRTSDYSSQAQLIDDLMVAIEETRIAFITYLSAKSTEPVTYDIYPLGIVYHRGSLYVVAQSKQHEMIRTFKVDRISDIQIEQLKFRPPAEFNLQDYLKDSLGIFQSDEAPKTIVIRFAPSVARYIEEHHWHASQKIECLKDGSLRLRIKVAATEEILSWILSFGSNAIVESPESLRLEVLNEIRILLRAYEKQKNRLAASTKWQPHLTDNDNI